MQAILGRNLFARCTSVHSPLRQMRTDSLVWGQSKNKLSFLLSHVKQDFSKPRQYLVHRKKGEPLEYSQWHAIQGSCLQTLLPLHYYCEATPTIISKPVALLIDSFRSTSSHHSLASRLHPAASSSELIFTCNPDLMMSY